MVSEPYIKTNCIGVGLGSLSKVGTAELKILCISAKSKVDQAYLAYLCIQHLGVSNRVFASKCVFQTP